MKLVKGGGLVISTMPLLSPQKATPRGHLNWSPQEVTPNLRRSPHDVVWLWYMDHPLHMNFNERYFIELINN